MKCLILRSIQVAIISVMATCIVSAQSYHNSPGDTLMRNAALEQPVVMNITQVHPTADTIYFHWRKIESTIPTGWDANICDNGSCYNSLIDSGMMIPIVPGDNGLMSIHCTPHTTVGTAIIRYALYATNAPAHIDTLTWLITVHPSGLEEENNEPTKVYSRAGILNIENAQRDYTELKIYDLGGRELIAAPIADTQQKILLPETNGEMLIVLLQGKDKKYSQTIPLH